ncbi:MAG: ABC transporter ATP-binding protein [Bifidobacterium animalis]|nr:ABC transporter ATP-binding protein/permease [Bifidobacterium animalis]MDY5040236.1 ABC transporter ATP-binding protein [Bifidobacterium animalis]
MTKQDVQMRELDELHSSDRVNEDERSAFEAQTNDDAQNETLVQEENSEKPHHAMKTARRLFAQMGNQRVRLAIVGASIVLYTVFNIAAPMYSAIVVNEIWAAVQSAWTGRTTFEISWGPKGLGTHLVVVSLLYFGVWVFYYLQCVLMASVAENLNLTLRKAIAAKLERLPLSFFDRNQPGEVLSRVTNDLDRISEVMQTGFLKLIMSVATIIGSMVMMFIYSWLLTLVFLVFVGLNLAITKAVAARNLAVAAQRQEAVGHLTGAVEEYYQGRDVIKASNREEGSAEHVRELTEQVRAVAQKADFLTNCINPLIRMFNRFSQAIVALLGGGMMLQGTMSIGVLQAFFQYMNQVGEPITEASYMINSMQSALASAERTFAMLDEPEETPDPTHPNMVEEPVRGRVEFQHVRFGYDPERPLMNDVDFVAEPGRKVAIVGTTGAGKTTLINLLMRFYDVDGGHITLDGVDTRTMTRADLRREFGMVLQDTWLFGGTVAENIAYGRPDATREQIVHAAKAAHADFFIRTLPDGYDTVLDNEANNLSVGQRQLLTIARVFLADPAMLIFDEATSSVDTRTEQAIAKAMNALMANRTSFVIAHRLSTIRDADLILYMEHGDILEHGTHEQLLAKDGAYANLYNSQFA